MQKRILIYLKLMLCMVVFISFHPRSTNAIEEYNAKALFIYHFTKYITWNNLEEKENFTVAVYKKCDIIAPLKQIASSKKIYNKKINIVNIVDNQQEIDCHILFLPAFVSLENYLRISQKMNRKNVLIISENKKLFQGGTGINFLIVEDKIKFEINTTSLENADLKISSQLLKLATNVKQE